MLAGAGLIGAELALYALYGWWKSHQTEEGDVPAWMGPVRLLLGWLTGGGIAAIGRELRQARLDQLAADNAEQRAIADVRVKDRGPYPRRLLGSADDKRVGRLVAAACTDPNQQ